MQFDEVLRSRRAVRSYSTERVDDATVHALLEAAVLAPSAMNEQPWAFSVIQDSARLKRYSDRAKQLVAALAGGDRKAHHYRALFGDPSFDIFYGATTLVVIGVGERTTYTDADCWLAAENLMLEACARGLGTCPIGFAVPVLNTVEVKDELSIPPGGAAVAPIIVGRPREPAPPVPRAKPRVAAWLR
ncbi:MAG TPA: nitroreductase family protein [Minicystis sp.]|nr:nitroreductase family protein [Minicystis sp.]